MTTLCHQCDTPLDQHWKFVDEPADLIELRCLECVHRWWTRDDITDISADID